MQDHQIGGSFVKRRFNFGDKIMTAGQRLSREELLTIPKPNRDALSRGGFLEHFPLADGTGSAADVAAPGEIFIAVLGKGEYAVVRGTRLNPKPMTREEADALAKKITARDAGDKDKT